MIEFNTQTTGTTNLPLVASGPGGSQAGQEVLENRLPGSPAGLKRGLSCDGRFTFFNCLGNCKGMVINVISLGIKRRKLIGFYRL